MGADRRNVGGEPVRQPLNVRRHALKEVVMSREIPTLTRAVCAAVLVFMASGCSPTEAGEAFVIQTDSTEYRLRHEGGIYSVTLSVGVTNPLDRTVFLHRYCGYGDNPSSELVRTDGDTTRIWLSSGLCTSQPSREPIPLHSGETYVDQLELISTESPNANPPITMEMRTGRFVLVYHVQLTNAVEGWAPVDPLPPARTTSNPFVVLPPE